MTRGTRSIITPTLLRRCPGNKDLGAHHGFETSGRIGNPEHNIPHVSILRIVKFLKLFMTWNSNWMCPLSVLVIIWVWAHVWEGLIDRVERDQLSRPEWCAGDDSEPLIGQRLRILPLIGQDQHVSIGNDSIKNLYNMVGGTVGRLSCGDIMEIKHWWMDHCSVLTEARWGV